MFASTPAGFKDAPVSRALCLGTLLLPLGASLFNVQYMFGLRIYPFLTSWHQWYRVLLNSSVYTDQTQAFIAAVLFYECRAVERLVGSLNFVRFAGLAYVAATVTTPLLLALLQPLVGSIEVAAGPTATVLALVTLYESIVPPVFVYTIQGVCTLTDKTLLLLLLPNFLMSIGGVMKTAMGVFIGLTMAKLV